MTDGKTQRIADLKAAQAAEEAAYARTDAAFHSLKEVATWDEVAEAAGMTRNQVHYRLFRDKFPSMQRKLLTPEEREARKAARTYVPPKDEGPGMGIAAAARELGVTRVTVYDWLEKGRLQKVEGSNGKARVATDKSGTIVQIDVNAARGVSISAAAKELGISRTTAYAWIKSGRLTPIEDGNGRPLIATGQGGRVLVTRDRDGDL